MIYIRNNDAIIDEISSQAFDLLIPSYWQNEMNIYSIYFQYANLSVPVACAVTKLYGFCEQPDSYTICPAYNVISYYADATHNAIWYNNEGDTIEEYIELDSPSLVFMPVPFGYNRLMYQNGKEIIVKQRPCMHKGKKVVVSFWDLYGQLQTTELQVGESNFSTDVDTDYRLANNGVIYYALLHPQDTYTVGVDYVTEDLYDFYRGLCSNGAILAMSKEDDITNNKPVSMSDASITTNVYGKNGYFTGTMEMKIGDNREVIK